MSGSSKLSDFFTNFRKRLEMDFCEDVDEEDDGILTEQQTQNRETQRDPKIDSRNKDSTLGNPFLTDFFSQLKRNHKSKKIWFNKGD